MSTTVAELTQNIAGGRYDDILVALYGTSGLEFQRTRYRDLLSELADDSEALLVIAPGRTELGGNHTDHNHGCVLAAAVDLDCVAAVTPVERPEVFLTAERYAEPIRVSLESLEPQPSERGTAEALVRGVTASLYNRTGTPNGFHGHLHATCLEGTGLSSSAAFSVLAGGAFNFLYENGKRSAQELAMVAQRAENDFFDKPCGLMDQMAVALGGTIFIDFKDPEHPAVTTIQHDLSDSGYLLAIVDTGTSHVGLTAEYGAANVEMKAAARVLGQPVARGVQLQDILDNLKEIRAEAGDRAALRLLHFVEENERVQQMGEALQAGRFASFLELVEASGGSSCNLLQNCATASSTTKQGILLALALSKRVCPEVVSRVHGGGFAGTIQSWVPVDEFNNYARALDDVFGPGSVIPVRLGRPGVCVIGGKGLVIPGPGSG